jgi:hypothetical protein
MQWIRQQTAIRRWVLALYALTAAVLGFIHVVPPGYPAPAAIYTADHALPDGTLPTLCITGADKGGSEHLQQYICDACLLTAAPGLAAASQTFLAHCLTVGETLSFALQGAALKQRPNHIAHLRGPPAPDSQNT